MTPPDQLAPTEARPMNPVPAHRYPRLAAMLAALAQRMAEQTPLTPQEIQKALGLPPPESPASPRNGKHTSHSGSSYAQQGATPF